jgi:hypothetical protein
MTTEIATNETKFGGLSVTDAAQIIAGAKELPDVEIDAAMIAAQIIGATSLEEGLGEKTAEKLQDHIGEPFIIHDARLQRSDEAYQGQGAPVFAVIDCTFTKTGEHTVMTTGSLNVLAGLVLIAKLEQWGQTFTTVTARTKAGFNAVRLVYIAPTVPVQPEREGETAF